MTLKVLSTPSFDRMAKKMHAKDRVIVDAAIRAIAPDHKAGEEKKGDLAGIFVYKFKLNRQEILLAYRLQPSKFKPKELVLLSLGTRESFYAGLKR